MKTRWVKRGTHRLGHSMLWDTVASYAIVWLRSLAFGMGDYKLVLWKREIVASRRRK